MIVVLAVVAVIVAAGVVAALLLSRGDRVGRPDLVSLAIDDPYTAWFNANSRCAMALKAWLDAAPSARPHAYRVYLATLELEEAAAAQLEMHAVAVAA